jgi:hypothetical protein
MIVMRIQTFFDAPRWRVGGCIAQSTKLTTQKARAIRTRGISRRPTIPV